MRYCNVCGRTFSKGFAILDRGVEKCPYCAEEPDEFLMTMVYVAIAFGLAGIGYALYAIATQ